MSYLNRNTAVYHNSVFAMNTQLDMVFWGGGQSAFDNIFQQIVSATESLELTLSRYHTDSELFKLNQLAGKKPVHPSTVLMNTIEMAARYNQVTNGYFDVSMGTVFHQFKNGEHPKHSTTERFSDRVLVNAPTQSVQFLQPNISLDFGGMGKGIAIHAISKIIDNHRIENAFISFGGSSILTRGRHPHGKFWPFCLAEHQEHVWQLNNDCLSVSSSHRKVSGSSAVHILNPFHCINEEKDRTVVVQTENAIDAEVLSTTLVAAAVTEHAGILSNFETAKYLVI